MHHFAQLGSACDSFTSQATLSDQCCQTSGNFHTSTNSLRCADFWHRFPKNTDFIGNFYYFLLCGLSEVAFLRDMERASERWLHAHVLDSVSQECLLHWPRGTYEINFQIIFGKIDCKFKDYYIKNYTILAYYMKHHRLKGPTWSIFGMPSFVANSRHNFAFNIQFLPTAFPNEGEYCV